MKKSVFRERANSCQIAFPAGVLCRLRVWLNQRPRGETSFLTSLPPHPDPVNSTSGRQFFRYLWKQTFSTEFGGEPSFSCTYLAELLLSLSDTEAGRLMPGAAEERSPICAPTAQT